MKTVFLIITTLIFITACGERSNSDNVSGDSVETVKLIKINESSPFVTKEVVPKKDIPEVGCGESNLFVAETGEFHCIASSIINDDIIDEANLGFEAPRVKQDDLGNAYIIIPKTEGGNKIASTEGTFNISETLPVKVIGFTASLIDIKDAEAMIAFPSYETVIKTLTVSDTAVPVEEVSGVPLNCIKGTYGVIVQLQYLGETRYRCSGSNSSIDAFDGLYTFASSDFETVITPFNNESEDERNYRIRVTGWHNKYGHEIWVHTVDSQPYNNSYNRCKIRDFDTWYNATTPLYCDEILGGAYMEIIENTVQYGIIYNFILSLQ